MNDEERIPRAPRCRCSLLPLDVEEARHAEAVKGLAGEVADQVSGLLPEGMRFEWPPDGEP